MADPVRATSLCHACPKLCRFACPVAEADQNEATTPWGKMSTMKLADRGHLPFDKNTASLAYKCLNCRASEEVCELGNPVPETLDFYRAKAFEQGVAPDAVYDFARRFQHHNNPYGADLASKRTRLFPKEGENSSRRIYFPGCTETHAFPETIEKTLKLFRRSGTNLSLYGDPIPCCGYPLYLAGDWENFRILAEINSQVLRRYREVISGDPGCLYAMETLYRKFGQKFSTRFFHVAEKLSQIRPGRSERIAYHDPCLLGRGRRVYDPPRRLIEQATGRTPREFFLNREKGVCCGAGGLLPVSSPETARKITESRLLEFRRTGAKTLVSASPGCLLRFKEIDPSLAVKTIVDLL